MYGFTKIEKRKACTVQHSTRPPFVSHSALLGGPARNTVFSAQPFASCFELVAPLLLSTIIPLRLEMLISCDAQRAPSGLPPPVSPFHVWQSISPRRPSAAACPQRHPGPGSSCLVRNVCCCFPPNTRQQGGSHTKSNSMFQNLPQNFIPLFFLISVRRLIRL